jgi:hypothetical protein
MASSVSSPSSRNPVGLWFCQISSSLQGSLQGGRADPPQLGAENGGTEGRRVRAPDAAGGKAGEDDTPRRTCRRDSTMPEATVYLLLDRFAPS